MKITKIVYSEIKRMRIYRAHLDALIMHPDFDIDIAEEISLYLEKLEIIESWLNLLKNDERFVIKYHLIEGLDWDRIVDEHRRRWGNKGRAKRTLRYYQESAIERIAQIVEQNWDCLSRIIMYGRDCV